MSNKHVLTSLYVFYIFLISSVYTISKHPVLIVVSYDAFRYNFFHTEQLPYMELIRQKGTTAEYLTNVFPTKTFPNHHSIATGMYPEVHGVIGNTYYDPEYKNVLGMSYQMYHYNDAVYPIWRWNEDLGDERYSGSVMWPGSQFSYQNKNITYSMPFEAGLDWNTRVDMVISWIMDLKKPANLVMLYIEEPDTDGHAFGPDSPIVKNLLQKLDNITRYLHKELEKKGLSDKVNVIHLSDHGMISVTPRTFLNITQYMQYGTYEWAGASPAIQIIPHKGYEETIYNALKIGSKKNGHFKVYKKSEYPDRWHYRDNSRSPPILVMADYGYALDDFIVNAPLYAKKYNFTLTNTSTFGVHGYDYTVKDMHPFFMAVGPKIKKQHRVDSFDVVDLFNLFCGILEISPTKNNGTEWPTNQILTNSGGKYSVSAVIMISGQVK